MAHTLTRLTRIAFGLLGFSSIILEIVVLSNEHVFNGINFFSFFTIISNILAAGYLMYFGITNNHSDASQTFRGAVTLYMLMTGVIFALLLSGLDNVRLTAVPWDNTVLHYIMPIVLVVDWLLSPPRKSLKRNVILAWITLPCVYILYTLIRGAVVGWYPYPFLNPSLSSYGQVIFTSAIIAIFVVGAAFLLRLPTLKHRGV